MGLARVAMVESETTCVVQRAGLVQQGFGGTGNHFLLFALLFTLLVVPPC